jgi:hypothetical protein
MESQRGCDSSFRSIFSALGLVVVVGSTYQTLFTDLIPYITNLKNAEPRFENVYLLDKLLFLIFSYVILAIYACLAVSIFKPLKKWDEDGLINFLLHGASFGLVGGLIIGSIMALFMVIISVSIIGLSFELCEVFIKGLLTGIIASTSLAIIIAILAGGMNEFKSP